MISTSKRNIQINSSEFANNPNECLFVMRTLNNLLLVICSQTLPIIDTESLRINSKLLKIIKLISGKLINENFLLNTYNTLLHLDLNKERKLG